MAIDANTRKRLQAGTRLVARYKQAEHTAEVVSGEEGRLRFRLADGREFRSPSAAGSAVMGGVACNGWRFWSISGEVLQAGGRYTPRPRPSCPRCGKTFVGQKNLDHHEANAARLCPALKAMASDSPTA